MISKSYGESLLASYRQSTSFEKRWTKDKADPDVELALLEIERKETRASRYAATGWLDSYCATIGDDGLLDSERSSN
jgi:hypothetical protein